MFVNVLFRVRTIDAGAAVDAANRYLESVRADTYDALFVVCPGTGVRAVLVGPDDWRKRERSAQRFLTSLRTEAQAFEMARDLRFYWLFRIIGGRGPRQALYDKLLAQYQSYVVGPDSERRFFRATAGMVRTLLDDGTWMEDVCSLDRYLAERDEEIALLLRHSTDATWPFCLPGPGVRACKCFDLGGTGLPCYVVMDVHV